MPAALERANASGRYASDDQAAARRDWRRAFVAVNPAGEVTAIRQKTWSAVSAVVTEMAFSGSAFEVDRGFGYTRLNIILDEVGDRIHGGETRKQAALRPHAPHRLYYVPGGAPFWSCAKRLRYLRYISLQFAESDLAALVGDDFDAALPQSPRLGFADSRLLALARVFEAECDRQEPSDPLLGDSLSISLLSLLKGVQVDAEPASRGGLTARQLKAVTDYLNEHLAEKIDLRTLAALTGLSASHFHRAFKASTRSPPHAWLLDLRISRAREIMLRTSKSLAEVALETGFSDQAHFTRTFSKAIGASPASWRRNALT